MGLLHFQSEAEMKYSKTFLSTHTYLECPKHPLPPSNEEFGFYHNSDVLAAGGYINCEICDTRMEMVAPLSMVQDLNRKLAIGKAKQLIAEARLDLYKVEQERIAGKDVDWKIRNLYNVIGYLSSILPHKAKHFLETDRGGTRCYKTAGDRKRGHTALKKLGWNYFVGYKEGSFGDAFPFGLQYGMSDQPYELDVRTNYPKH